MPSTINGIGTSYYGRKNLRRHHGRCEQCGHEADLSEYETTLWFVVIFVPIIPLGKKQIFEDCSICRKHLVMPLKNWKDIQERTLRNQMEEVSKNPESVEATIDLLNSFVAFHRSDDAARLASILEQQFPQDVKARLRLGAWCESIHEPAQADIHFRKALELEPDNLAAKHAVAVGLIQQGNLDGARRLLDAAPAISPRMDPGVYLLLAETLAGRGQPEEALDLYNDLLDTFPAMRHDPKMRKQILRLEREACRQDSMLPIVPFHRQRWFGFTAVAVAVLLLIVGIEFYIAHHRTLQVVNGFEEDATVRLEGGEQVRVPAKSARTLPTTEGEHRAVVSFAGKPDRTVDFAMTSNPVARLFRSPAYVFNIDGGAVIGWEKIYYGTAQPEGDDFKISLGQPFVTFDDVDYAFINPPQQLKTESKSAIRTHVDAQFVDPGEMLFSLPDSVSWDDRLAMAEAHLRMKPDHWLLLQVYAAGCNMQNQKDRCLRFLETGLNQRPMVIEWHRIYQSIRQLGDDDDDAKLIAEYQRRLDADPGNSALLYLRGRLEPDQKRAEKLYDQAIAADPTNAYPWYAKSYHRMARGEAKEAVHALEEALHRRPNDEEMKRTLQDRRVAAGDWATLERELREERDRSPKDLSLFVSWIQVLVLQNHPLAEIDTEFQIYEQAVSATKAHDGLEVLLYTKLLQRYVHDELQKMAEEAQAVPDADRGAIMAFRALLDLGQLEAAGERLATVTSPQPPYDELCLSIAWRQRGDTAKADEWQARARKRSENVRRDERTLIELLDHIPNVSFAEIEELGTTVPSDKATVLVALAQQCPQDRAPMAALAKKLNYGIWFPRRMLDKALESLAGSEP